MDDLKTRKRNLIMFPLGTVGRDMVYFLFTSCIMTFVLFTRDLTNAQFRCDNRHRCRRQNF